MKWHLRLVIFIMNLSVSLLLLGLVILLPSRSWAQESAEEVTSEPSIESSSVPDSNEELAESESKKVEAAEPSSADDSTVNAGLVEIQYPDVYQGPYRESRGTHAFMLDLNYQQYVPTNYISALDNATYKNAYENNSINIIEIQLNYKYNFLLGGLTFGLGYGMGSTSSQASGTDRTINLTKTSGAIGYIMDTLFEEPYVAPYGQIQAWQMGIKESNSTTSFSADTKLGFAYRLGLLIQLNWIDEGSAETGAHNFGLDNTYLDVFATKYSKTQSTVDADTESEFSFGAGLRLEY